MTKSQISPNADYAVPQSAIPLESTGHHASKNYASKDIAVKALEAAVELRSLDPVALYIAPHSTVGDYFVIASGTSERHTQGIADKVREKLGQMGVPLIRSSGYENGEWIILDYGDVIVHAFYEPSRHYYQLDQLWADSEAVELDGRLAEEAKKLRTGTL